MRSLFCSMYYLNNIPETIQSYFSIWTKAEDPKNRRPFSQTSTSRRVVRACGVWRDSAIHFRHVCIVSDGANPIVMRGRTHDGKVGVKQSLD
ncbi:hypothetical protein EVAR_6217_1 [Eumeta japonica]|uniref:Uncharacterized protein n=1 Tax=Eumeta variegata TaxID=151549 RepID=A0A4C1Z3D0_EUMVA|nr:hypothetical protein EVAR_6217_1 [Eumeta japonica]